MKAIIYTEYGAPEVLRVAEVDTPKPSAGEILIRVEAAEVTKADCEMRSFNFAVKWFWLPLRLALGVRRPRRPILGSYFSGVVEALGSGVSQFKVGDAVFGSSGLHLGAYGQYVSLPATSTLAAKPDQLPFVQAAAVPLGGLNALHFMRLAKIQAGEHVLVNGAGGSIGCFAVQLAKAMGAQVTAVDHKRKQELLLRIGADHFIDYQKDDFSAAGQSYDVVFDMVAQSSYQRCVGVLKPKGRYLMGNPRLTDMFRSVFTTWLTDKSVHFAFAGEKEQELRSLCEMIERGELAPTIDSVCSPEEIVVAHYRVEREERLGSIVVSLWPSADSSPSSTMPS